VIFGSFWPERLGRAARYKLAMSPTMVGRKGFQRPASAPSDDAQAPRDMRPSCQAGRDACTIRCTPTGAGGPFGTGRETAQAAKAASTAASAEVSVGLERSDGTQMRDSLRGILARPGTEREVAMVLGGEISGGISLGRTIIGSYAK
jgi:hypothetical protein